MWHLKLIGSFWLLIGGFWSVLALWCLVAPAPVGPGVVVTKSAAMWWQDVIGGTLEVGFFVSSAASGFALLRHWRHSRVAIFILGSLWLTFCAYIIFFTEGGLPILDLFWGPFTFVAICSLVVLPFVKYEPKPA